MATVNVQELQALVAVKEARIRELENQLRLRDEEIVDLRSHLDMFQSVFPYHMASPTHNHNNNHLNSVVVDNGLARPRKQRAQGISAEPQSIHELSQQKFPTFPKNDRSVGSE